jgi:hypothetical protein
VKWTLEGAKAVLGHADTKITEIYAERDLELAMRIMGGDRVTDRSDGNHIPKRG